MRRFKESRLHREERQREKMFPISKRVNTDQRFVKLMTEHHLFYSLYNRAKELDKSTPIIGEEEAEELNHDNLPRLLY